MFDIYLHQFLKSDDNQALHDHPAASVAIVLRGKYTEWLQTNKYKIRMEGGHRFAACYDGASHRNRRSQTWTYHGFSTRAKIKGMGILLRVRLAASP
jgi:hypothetical protein